MRALIVETGTTRGSLVGARALARAGWTVGVGCPSSGGLARWSRHTSAWHRVPTVQQDLEGFLSATSAAVKAGRYDVVFCAGDAETLALCYGRDRIDAIVPYPDYEDARRAFDKLELAHAARQAGLAAPETRAAGDDALGQTSLPVVVKSRFHWTPEAAASTSRLEAKVCHTREDAERRAREMREQGGEPLLQEVLSGPPTDLHLVADRAGRVVAAVPQVSEALFFPPGTGRRIRSRTVSPDPETIDRVAALVRELKWFGMTGLDFLRNARGVPCVTDFNGRYQLHMQQSVAAGVNLPAIWAAVATGRPPPGQSTPTPGVRYQWLEGDLKRAVRERRGGLLRDLADCLRYSRGAAHTLLDPSDPWPGLRHVARLAAGRVQRAAPQPAARRPSGREPDAEAYRENAKAKL